MGSLSTDLGMLPGILTYSNLPERGKGKKNHRNDNVLADSDAHALNQQDHRGHADSLQGAESSPSNTRYAENLLRPFLSKQIVNVQYAGKQIVCGRLM